MTSQSILRVDGVSKMFRKGEMYDSLRDVVPALTGRLFRRGLNGKSSAREFWALRDVSFEVRKGEAFGIIGSNGAGKSTMLKLLSGIMKPTYGSVEVHGRLSALIEVGAGFHPDLTGRENIFLNGTILGMRRAEIRRKFDEIVEFAGLAEFLDTPVKRYSSGMYARLGFSVAAHVEPDLLIVDEVLSVGDYLFQKKCAEKMASIIHGGATVIFVSHNLRAISELCGNSMLLEKGVVKRIGPTGEVVGDYLSRSEKLRSGNDNQDVVISDVTVRHEKGPKGEIRTGSRMFIDVRMTAKRPVRGLSAVLDIKSTDFYIVFNTSTERMGEPAISLEAGESVQCTFELDVTLASGTYHVDAYLYRYDTQTEYDHWRSAASFYCVANPAVRGIVDLAPKLSIQRLAPEVRTHDRTPAEAT